MTMSTPSELLYDSEAALRLVDTAMGELCAGSPPAPVRPAAAASPAASPALASAHSAVSDLPALLLRAYGEITGVLTSLREGRDAIAQATVEKIQQTHAKLSEVTSATEVAATDILNSLDRAQEMLDELDALDADGPARAAELRGQLRDELFQVTGSLQFQDITTQQLTHASSVLVETEHRLAQLAEIFDPSIFGLRSNPLPPTPLTFDPAASIHGAEVRQALADQLFAPR